MAKIIEMKPVVCEKSPVYAVMNIPCYQPVIPQVRKDRRLKRIANMVDMVMSIGVGAMLFLVLTAMLVAL